MTTDFRTTQRLTAISYDEPAARPATPVVPWRDGDYTAERLAWSRGRRAYDSEAITRVEIPAIQD